MGRRLISMTWADVKEEMSIAGSPDKITELADSLMRQVESKVDYTNHAELTNMMFALDRIKAEVKGAQRRLEQRTFTKIINLKK